MKIYLWIYCLATTALMALSQPTSITDFEAYNQLCEQAAKDPSVFAHFRNHQIYCKVLEHVSPMLGRQYLDAIKAATPELLQNMEAFRKNDAFGNPPTYFYPETGRIAPTTLRYIKVASDLKRLFGSSLEGSSIIEIGGGYGGQCKIIADLYKFKSYTLVDLPGPIALTKEFLKKQKVPNVYFKTFDEVIADESFDLVISNYAYTECSAEMQEKYCQEILSHSKRGYLICTQEPGSLAPLKEASLARFKSYGIAYEIFPEDPCSNPVNYLVIWRST